MDVLDYRFASDNTAGICPEAWAALVQANHGQPASYSGDAWTSRARELLRATFETDCEVFFAFTGTAANALALAAICQNHQSVVCHEFAHIARAECGATGFFTGGAGLLTVPGADASLPPAAVESLLLAHPGTNDRKPRALSITQATELGAVYTLDQIGQLIELARKHNLNVHMDGARFANAVAALAEHRGVKPADLTWRAGVDVLSLGGAKNGSGMGEAIVFFNRRLAADFEYRRRQSGQLASKMRFISCQWVGLLQDGAWLRNAAQANAMARALAAELRRCSRLKVLVEPETNTVMVEIPSDIAAAIRVKGWFLKSHGGADSYRLMCSWATQSTDVDELIADLRTVTR